MTKLWQWGEFPLIKLLTKGFKAGNGVVVSVGDDCAVLTYTPKEYLLWTSDLLFEGVHFLKDAPPSAIGHKALAVSLSDIAAMAGKPLYCQVFVGLPSSASVAYCREIYRGISQLAKRYGVKIVGGDTNAFEKLVIGTTVLGVVEKDYLTLRNGAAPGDLICLSGKIGKGKETHLSFLPKVKEARKIKRLLCPTAMIDLSDGLLSDFTRIAEESHVGGRIFLEQIPAVAGVKKEEALISGEEFELLFTVKPKMRKKVLKAGFFLVGEVTKRKDGIKTIDNKGKPFLPPSPGYNHFKREKRNKPL